VLTELEGAILWEIGHFERVTAFQVRKAFAVSVSLEWKGSAGAVYPAVKRLEARGYVAASAAEGGRGARHLSLTDKGEQALVAWGCDVNRAASIGIDPFRLRSSIWAELPDAARKQVFAELRAEIAAALPALERQLASVDASEKFRIDLSLETQRARLRTLERWEASEAMTLANPVLKSD
jgi:DNA-binding PadR family transcriptional regulator